MRAIDGHSVENIDATTAAFNLIGGLYAIDVAANFGGGSVKLQRDARDGSTLVSVSSQTDFTTAGYAAVNLPPGTYKLTIDATSSVFAQIPRRVPGE